MGMNGAVRFRVVVVLVVGIFCGACQRRAVVSQPETGLLLEAEEALRRGTYDRADDLYQALGDNDPSFREIALARRALIYALPGTALHDREAARGFLDQLLAEYPDSLMRTEAEAVLGVLPAVDELRSAAAVYRSEGDLLRAVVGELDARKARFERFLAHVSPLDPAFDLELARSEYRNLLGDSGLDAVFREAAEELLFLVSQWQQLGVITADYESALDELRTELRVLGEELEKLKEIDLGRRLPD